MSNQIKDIAGNVINTEVPFFPSFAWELTAADFGIQSLWTFNWIQAFWDTTLFTETPVLVVAGTETTSAGVPIVSQIQFAYSGERINFKGKSIFLTGVDRRDVTVTSANINPASPADSFLKVIAYGGNY